jgi:hypothetical protein
MRSLKFITDRRSLETIYLSFIRPLLEYSDIVWDNITQQDEFELEKIQLEACRIITGTTKLVSLSNLYEDTCFQPLKFRRYKHKLILLYKMFNHLSPQYLSSIVPNTVGETSVYNLTNASNTRNIFCQTQLYSNSFLPSLIKDWNDLPVEMHHCLQFSKKTKWRCPKSSSSLLCRWKKISNNTYTIKNTSQLSERTSVFKKHNRKPFLYMWWNRKYRTLFPPLPHVSRWPHCPNKQFKSNVTTVTLNTLLYGDNSLTDAQNETIISHIHKYIHKTKRLDKK